MGGKTPQLPIITQVSGHAASKRRHCSAFKLKSQVIKTFISLLKFSLKCGESLKRFFEQFDYSCYGSSEVTRVSEVTLDDGIPTKQHSCYGWKGHFLAKIKSITQYRKTFITQPKHIFC